MSGMIHHHHHRYGYHPLHQLLLLGVATLILTHDGFSKKTSSSAYCYGQSTVTGAGDDASCLSGLRASVTSGIVASWYEPYLKTPCITPALANLTGITCNDNRVYSITLNSSNLAGTIPSSLSNCSLLAILDLSSNHLSGPIPATIGNLTYLIALNFSGNRISGPIPVELARCTYLNFIDLHRNKLSGMIPGQIGILQRLKVFDVSENDLSGPIPVTLSNTSTGAPRFNASSFVGNPDLYGYPLPPESSHGLSVLTIVGIGLASGLISLIVSFSAVCLWLRVREQGFVAQEGKISQLMSES